MINFLNMKYFMAVAEARSFTLAAESLYISQQTLSAHIAQLEMDIGMPLFERTRPLTLTPAGERFLNGVREILFINAQLDRELQDMANPTNMSLHIGITHAYARALLPTLLSMFFDIYPYINMQIHELSYDQMDEMLSKGTVDFLITRPSYCGSGVEVIPLWENDDIYLYAPTLALERIYGDKAGQIIASLKREPQLSTIEKCPFILPRTGNLRNNVTQMFLDARLSPAIHMETDTLETAIFLCRHGLGVTISPGILLNAYGYNNENDFSDSAYLISNCRPEYSMAICYLKQTHITKAMNAFVQMAKENYAAIKCLL